MQIQHCPLALVRTPTPCLEDQDSVPEDKNVVVGGFGPTATEPNPIAAAIESQDDNQKNWRKPKTGPGVNLNPRIHALIFVALYKVRARQPRVVFDFLIP